MMFHITATGSACIENVWLWTADHDIDDAQNSMVSVYVARGMLVESQGPVWLYGTASEHAVIYQYEFYNAAEVYASMIQTESVRILCILKALLIFCSPTTNQLHRHLPLLRIQLASSMVCSHFIDNFHTNVSR
jgi:hypothetical protein